MELIELLRLEWAKAEAKAEEVVTEVVDKVRGKKSKADAQTDEAAQ